MQTGTQPQKEFQYYAGLRRYKEDMADSREPRRGTESRQLLAGRRGSFRRELRTYGEGEEGKEEREKGPGDNNLNVDHLQVDEETYQRDMSQITEKRHPFSI